MTDDRENRWLRWVTVVLVVLVAVVVSLVLYFRPTVVPDLVGQPSGGVSAVLDEAGLSLGERSELATTVSEAGLVIEQDPAPDRHVSRHSSVDVTVAVAPVPSAVPDVFGKDEAAAAEQLADALYLMLPVDVFTEEASRGVVVAQLPAPGSEWLTGRPVAVAVSLGPDDGTGVEVPDLTGVSTQSALDTIDKLGLVSSGFVMDPAAVTESVVVSQMPKPGAVVPPGSRVLLLLDND